MKQWDYPPPPPDRFLIKSGNAEAEFAFILLCCFVLGAIAVVIDQTF